MDTCCARACTGSQFQPVSQHQAVPAARPSGHGIPALHPEQSRLHRHVGTVLAFRPSPGVWGLMSVHYRVPGVTRWRW